MMRDYYKDLEITEGATEDQIKKAYRRLALKYHPDRNPGSREAEEEFKRIAVAYGVLIDPVKRSQYDKARLSGRDYRTGPHPDFNYSQEEILRDLFNNPQFNRVFQQLFREFSRQGYRFDQQFFENSFGGGRGFLFGGVFVFGPFGRSTVRFPNRDKQSRLTGSHHLIPGTMATIKKIGRRILGLPDRAADPHTLVAQKDHDLHYDLYMSSSDIASGRSVNISLDRDGGRETLRVKVPPHSKDGMKLRLKGKGSQLKNRPGDLYIHLREKKS